MTYKHINYIFTGSKIDAIAAQFPKQKLMEMKNNNQVKEWANPELCNLVVSDTVKYCIWIPIFKAFDTLFLQSIENSNLYRFRRWGNKYISLNELVKHLFYEYCEWINYISKEGNNCYSLKRKKKDIIPFLLIFNNKMFLLSKVDSYLKQNYGLINPFINFWYTCKLLRQSLDLPLNTIFLPDIDLESIQALKFL